MTVSSTERTAGPFIRNGTQLDYPFTMRVFRKSDVSGTMTTSEGAVSLLVQGTHYTVDINADQRTSPGGTIHMTSGGTAGDAINFTTSLAALQGARLTNAGGFYPEVIEDALDYLTVLIQQLQTGVWGFEYPSLTGNGGRYLSNDGANLLWALAPGGGEGGGGNFTPPGTGGVERTMQDRALDVVYVTDYMSDAQRADVRARTYALDVSGAIQDAIDYAISVGKRLHFPGGAYRVDTALVADMSAITSDTAPGRVNISGDGSANTHIASNVSGSAPLLHVIGGAGASEGVNARLQIDGLRFMCYAGRSSRVGLRISRAAYLHLHDLGVWGFNVGFDGVDVLSFRGSGLHFNNCNRGCVLGPSATGIQYNPNGIEFDNVQISGCDDVGMVITKPGNVTIRGRVEVCGLYGGVDRGGIWLISPGAESPVGVNIACYFEANNGGYDVRIDHGNTPSLSNFSGSNFNRTDVAQFTTHNIVLNQSISESVLNLNGAAFEHFNSYVPNVGRAYVKVNSTGGRNVVIDDGAYYHSSTERPTFGGRSMTVNSRVAMSARFAGNGGNGVSPLATGAGYNCTQFEKHGTGEYSVVATQDWGTSFPRWFITTNDFLICSVIGDGSNYVRFQLKTAAGVLADAGAVSVVVFA